MKVLSRPALFAVLAMLGVVLVFLFPATCGPFSVTNGPATVFRALTAARAVFAAMGAAMLLDLVRHSLHSLSATAAAEEVHGAPLTLALRC